MFAKNYSPKAFLIALIFSAPLLLPSCSKNESDASSSLFVNFGPGEGISYRDNNNRPVGPGDPTDWTQDGDWNSRERALFSSLGLSLNAAPQGQSTRLGFAGYPNPAVSQFTFSYFVPDPVACRFVLVDGSYRVLTQGESSSRIKNGNFSVDGSRLSLKSGKRYRVYYVLYTGTTLYAKGHGDIKIGEL
jgi:hypothetical protein